MSVTETKPTIGRTIRQLRLAKGYSQGELAKRADVTPSYINRLERGVEGYAAPRLSTIRRLGGALGLSVPEIQALFGILQPLIDLTPQKGLKLHRFGREDKTDIEKYSPGEAYILMQVGPAFATDVCTHIYEHIERMQQEDISLKCCVAVKGVWDIIAWVKCKNYEILLRFIDRFYGEATFKEKALQNTETMLARWDWAYLESDGAINFADGKRFGFIFIKLHPGTVGSYEFMERILTITAVEPEITHDEASILHVTTLTGRFDVVVTVRYRDEPALDRLVRRIQVDPRKRWLQQSVTVQEYRPPVDGVRTIT